MRLRSSSEIARSSTKKSSKGLLEVNAGGQPYLVKMPFNPVALASMKRQREALERLKKHSGIRQLVPATPLHGSLQGVDYFVESRLSGRRLAEELRHAGREAYLEQVVGLLGATNPRVAGIAKVQLVGDLFRKEVDEPLEHSPELIAPLADVLRRGLLAAQFVGGVVHGDFKASNILVAEGRISGLIGWDLFRL